MSEPRFIIGPIPESSLDDLLDVHEAALPGSIPTRFGRPFFRLYYEALMQDPDFFCVGAFIRSRLVGFFAFSSNSREGLRSAFRRWPLRFFRALARGLLERPSRCVTLWQIVAGSFTGGNEPGGDIRAELLSLGVLAEHRRSARPRDKREVPISHELVGHALNTLRERGVDRVKAFTKPEHEDPLANSFWVNQGFELVGRCRMFGHSANFYVRKL